jgi:hypothetical protein
MCSMLKAVCYVLYNTCCMLCAVKNSFLGFLNEEIKVRISSLTFLVVVGHVPRSLFRHEIPFWDFMDNPFYSRSSGMKSLFGIS